MPFLLTKNMKLYREFIARERNRDKLEDLINENGMEHLIKVVSLKEYMQLY